ncbi:uncharacterized protein BX663DRAFT_516318 [Cokeromyces recurvatus]|uniref:uncharacterized protein n=1 Tax=Cokeromyces recurvatus TaxID=90255 RepID=UPI00222109E3|nr:uncharacterized protein BX663DRAFT_516318 [Cokeromyces recurvatus]KAI7900733.1 hypothetical protein BX663DRAFT_516318 [Cokeromyces recurvatus]
MDDRIESRLEVGKRPSRQRRHLPIPMTSATQTSRTIQTKHDVPLLDMSLNETNATATTESQPLVHVAPVINNRKRKQNGKNNNVLDKKVDTPSLHPKERARQFVKEATVKNDRKRKRLIWILSIIWMMFIIYRIYNRVILNLSWNFFFFS